MARLDAQGEKGGRIGSNHFNQLHVCCREFSSIFRFALVWWCWGRGRGAVLYSDKCHPTTMWNKLLWVCLCQSDLSKSLNAKHQNEGDLC